MIAPSEGQLWQALRPWFTSRFAAKFPPNPQLRSTRQWSGITKAVLEDPSTLHTPPPSAMPQQVTQPKPLFLLKFVFWMSRITGILPYRYDTKNEILVLSKWSVAYSVGAMIFLFSQWSFLTEELHTDYVQEGNVLSGLEPIILTVLNCSLMLLALLRSSHLRLLVSILTNFDAELSPLGSGPSMWVVAFPGALCVVVCLSDIITSVADDSDTLMFAPYYWSVTGAVLVETQFNAACYTLRYWYWILNERLRMLRRRAPGAALRLESLRLTHGHLYLAATELESAFGPQLLLGSGICFVGTVLNSYFGFNGYYDKGNDVSDVMQNMQWVWALLYLARVSVVCFVTTRLMLEASRTGRLLHALNDTRLAIDMKEEIIMFSMQLSSSKIEFTAWGVLAIDFSLFFAIVSSTTTYLLILIQYRPK